MSTGSNSLPFSAEQLQQFAAMGIHVSAGPAPPPSQEDHSMLYRKQQAAMIKEEEKALKEPLTWVTDRSKEVVIRQAKEYREELLRQMKEGQAWETVAMGYRRPFSEKPLSELTSIEINSMRVTQTHKGRYLVGRIVSQPWGAASIRFALEDTTGRAEICEIRYFPLKNIVTGPDLDRILPLGTILFIREPTFRVELSFSGPSLPFISVNSPTDVVFLRPDHPRLETITWSSPSPTPSSARPVDFQALGDSLADEGKLQLAVKAYSDGLFTSLDSKQKLVIQLSRAKVQLRLDNFAAAVRGAASVIRMIDEGVEGGPGMMSGAILVMAKGYEGLRLFAKAESSYRRFLQLIPANSPRAKVGKEGQKRMRTNQVDAAVARFIETNVNELHEPKAWDKGYDLADWFGPITIAGIPGREGGRGIVTTRDVAPGELLMVEKAFVHGATQEFPENLNLSGQDLAVGSKASGSEIRLVSNLVARLCDDPSAVSCVNALYGGPNYPSFVTPTLDQPAQRAFDAEDTPTQPNLDVDRLEAVCSYNRFILPLYRDDIPDDDTAGQASALFLAGSIFNHHCLPNSTGSFHRDVSIVRARAAMKKGEEVFISYFPIGEDHDARQKYFGPVFEKGVCPCEICQLDRIDGPEKVALRHKILKEEFLPYRQKKQSGVPIQIEESARIRQQLLPILARLESTYSSSRGSLRPELSDVYHLIADSSVPVPVHLRQVAIDYRLKAFESAGAKFEKKGIKIKVIAAPVLVHQYLDSVGICLLTSCTYLQTFPQDIPSCLSWLQAAVDMDKLLRQGSYASVRQGYAQVIKELNIGYLLDEAEKGSFKKKK